MSARSCVPADSKQSSRSFWLLRQPLTHTILGSWGLRFLAFRGPTRRSVSFKHFRGFPALRGHFRCLSTQQRLDMHCIS
ncbi:hypothetical protein NDU88_008123 [Pleurodeles waltl]|uniref:Uncharacterized protein n=1 Tax=Pleurodeles waltl TaxID=8319 RepID=A0AAV7PND9_PLEWA|nr:hypothetical protein NDU88_008123 [Pleurodeles waltl]